LISLDFNPITLYWLTRFQEVLTEMALRHGPYPAGWSPGFINENRLPGSLSPVQLDKLCQLKLQAPLPQSFLVKYGKIQYIEAAYNKGQIRVAPASAYSDPSLNTAIRDEELIAQIDFDPTFLGMYGGLDPDQIVRRNMRRVTHQKMKTNYYVYCTARELSTRLLLDFEGDAALIIRNPDTFLQRLDVAMRQQLPGWHAIVKAVKYYDPLRVTPEEVDVLVCKHFRYAYQNEVRVAWLPPEPILGLEPIFVELGCLSDIAEVLYPTDAERGTEKDPRMDSECKK
jgi:hypothetical protein